MKGDQIVVWMSLMNQKLDFTVGRDVQPALGDYFCQAGLFCARCTSFNWYMIT